MNIFDKKHTDSDGIEPSVQLTTRDVLAFVPNGHQYMVAPYNERTRGLLQDGIIEEEEDDELVKLSDEFEKTKIGGNEQIQKVKAFGVIMYNSIYEYEDHWSSYLLILVDPEDNN